MQDDTSEWTPGRAQFWDHFYSEDGGRLQQKALQCRRSEKLRHGHSLMDHYEWFMPYALYDDALQSCLKDCLAVTSVCSIDESIRRSDSNRRRSSRKCRTANHGTRSGAFRVLHIGCGNSDFADHFCVVPATGAHGRQAASSSRSVDVLNVDICADLISRLARTFPHRHYAVGDVCALVNPRLCDVPESCTASEKLCMKKPTCAKDCCLCAGWYATAEHPHGSRHTSRQTCAKEGEDCATRLLSVVPNSVDLIFDKGTADALLSGFPGEVNPNFAACTREALRVLRAGGVYICISINSSNTLSPYFFSASVEYIAGADQSATENPSRFFELRHQSVIELVKDDVDGPRVETLGSRYNCYGNQKQSAYDRAADTAEFVMSSKYDSVKITVTLPGQHYFLLSRYLLSRILTFCKVPPDAAERISLDVKRQLVRSGTLHITQVELLRNVCMTMCKYGFAGVYVSLLPVILQFYMKSVPIVVLLAAGGSCGATTIAQQLASRLSCHRVLNSETLLDMACVMHSCDEYSANEETDGVNCAGACPSIEDMTDVPYRWRVHETLCTSPTRNVLERQRSTSVSSRVRLAKESCCCCQTGTHAALDAASPSDNTVSATTAETIRLQWLRRSQQVSRVAVLEIQHAIDRGKVLIIEGTYLDLCALRRFWQKSYQKEHGVIVLPVVVRATPWARQVVSDYTKKHSMSFAGLRCQDEGCSDETSDEVQDLLTACTVRDEMHMHILQSAREQGVRIVPVNGVSGVSAHHGMNALDKTSSSSSINGHATSGEMESKFTGAKSPSSSSSSIFSSASTEAASHQADSRTGGVESSENFSTVYEVCMTHPTMLPHITNSLHDLIIKRILAELSCRNSS